MFEKRFSKKELFFLGSNSLANIFKIKELLVKQKVTSYRETLLYSLLGLSDGIIVDKFKFLYFPY